MGKHLSLEGQRFGSLRVLSLSDDLTKHHQRQWLCQCDCGETALVQTSYLRSGDTTSCGCRKHAGSRERHAEARKSRISAGAVFGRLSVKAVHVRDGRTICQCSCACGKKNIVAEKELRSGHTTSCGCYRREKCAERAAARSAQAATQQSSGRTCPCCGLHKASSDFAGDVSSTRGIQAYCRTCTSMRKAGYALKKYGVSSKDYKTVLAEQGGKCRICGGTPEDGKRLSIDHDHATGVARGLLCPRCNAGLGMFRDNPSFLASAIAYLAAARSST